MNNGQYNTGGGEELRAGKRDKRDFSVIGFACAALLVINYGGTAGALWLYSFLSGKGILPAGLFAAESLSLLILEAVIGYAIAFPVAILTVKKLIKGTVPAVNCVEPIKASPLELVCITFFAAFVGTALGEFAESLLPSSEGAISAMPSGATEITLYFLILVVIIPVLEEYFFRKVLGEALIVWGDIPAILIPAMLGGFYHGNLGNFFVAFFEGLVLGYIYVRTRRTLYPVLVRAAVNLLAGFIPALAVILIGDIDEIGALSESLADAVSRLPVSVEAFNSLIPEISEALPSMLTVELLNGLISGIALAGFILFVSYFSKLRLAVGTKKLDGKEIGDTVFLAPGILVFIVLSIVVIALSYSSFSFSSL